MISLKRQSLWDIYSGIAVILQSLRCLILMSNLVTATNHWIQEWFMLLLYINLPCVQISVHAAVSGQSPGVTGVTFSNLPFSLRWRGHRRSNCHYYYIQNVTIKRKIPATCAVLYEVVVGLCYVSLVKASLHQLKEKTSPVCRIDLSIFRNIYLSFFAFLFVTQKNKTWSITMHQGWPQAKTLFLCQLLYPICWLSSSALGHSVALRLLHTLLFVKETAISLLAGLWRWCL